MLGVEPVDKEEDRLGDLGVAALDEQVKRQIHFEKVEEPGSYLPAKGSGARITMAAVSRVPVVLAAARGTKGVIHFADGRRSMYRQVCEGWNKAESGSLEKRLFRYVARVSCAGKLRTLHKGIVYSS